MGRYYMEQKAFAGLGQATIPGEIQNALNQLQQAGTLSAGAGTNSIEALNMFQAGTTQLMNSISSGDWESMGKAAATAGCSAALASVGASSVCSLIGPVWDWLKGVFAVDGDPYRDFLRWCCEVAGIPFSKEEKTCQRLAKLYDNDWEPHYFARTKESRNTYGESMKAAGIPFRVRAGSTAYWELPERLAPGWSEFYGEAWESLSSGYGQYYGLLHKTTDRPQENRKQMVDLLRNNLAGICIGADKKTPQQILTDAARFISSYDLQHVFNKPGAWIYAMGSWLKMWDRAAITYPKEGTKYGINESVTPLCMFPSAVTATIVGYDVQGKRIIGEDPADIEKRKKRLESKGMSTPAKVALGVGGAGVLFFIARKLLVKV